MYVCVCMCVCEREREGKDVVCVCMCETECGVWVGGMWGMKTSCSSIQALHFDHYPWMHRSNEVK